MKERATIDALLEAIGAGAIHSAHDCSDGGLAVALAECCVMNREQMLGADVKLDNWSALPLRALLFGETQGRIVVSTSAANVVLSAAKKHGVTATSIGFVRESSMLKMRVGSRVIDAPLSALEDAYHEAIPRRMAKSAAAAEAAFTAATPA
jgi:phosphoribosylformylglycinamidine synthase